MVDHIHNQYTYFSKMWEKCRDVLEGSAERIKEKSIKYLPKLPGQDDYNYDGYKHRAQFINFASRTLQASLGQLFRKDPLMTGFDYPELLEDIDLSGTDLDSLFREVADEVYKTNRVGILVDYSEENKRPYLSLYKTENIINWRTEYVNGKNQLSLVVLSGTIDAPDPDDEFETVNKKIYKALRLVDGFYYVTDYEEVEQNKKKVIIEKETYQPMMNNDGIKYIPFYLITTDGLSTKLMRPPLLDLINVNLGHFTNSADYENALHYTGSRTIITRGWGDDPFPIGGCANFPIDGGAEFLSAQGDDALEKALVRKEEQMAVLGSNILSNRGKYVQSAESARVSSAGELAALSDVSRALSSSMTYVLRLMVEWLTGAVNDVSVEFNTDFEVDALNPQELIAWMGAVQSGMLSDKAFYYLMKQREAYPADWTFELEQSAIQEQMKNKLQTMNNNLEEVFQG